MFKDFFYYFLSYIFRSKTRQKLLFIAVSGLFISSMALTIIQGVMGGLQNGLIKRSRMIQGDYQIEFLSYDKSVHEEIVSELQINKTPYSIEYEIELLLKNQSYISPAILHGVDLNYLPEFLKEKDMAGVVLGGDLATKTKSYFESKVLFISPTHTDDLLGDVPRQISVDVTDFYTSDLFEIDSIHAWSSLKNIQRLIRLREINKINIFSDDVSNKTFLIAKDHPKTIQIKSWEQMNQSLVWALGMETKMMIFLFVGMTLLVSLSITSGFLIFYDKIKMDLMSFWILGKSKKSIFKLSFIFSQVLSILFIILGILFGLAILYLLKSQSYNIFPDIFVERRIPVLIRPSMIFISLFFPYFISSFFSYFSFKTFRSENSSFIKNIRQFS